MYMWLLQYILFTLILGQYFLLADYEIFFQIGEREKYI